MDTGTKSPVLIAALAGGGRVLLGLWDQDPMPERSLAPELVSHASCPQNTRFLSAGGEGTHQPLRPASAYPPLCSPRA